MELCVDQKYLCMRTVSLGTWRERETTVVSVITLRGIWPRDRLDVLFSDVKIGTLLSIQLFSPEICCTITYLAWLCQTIFWPCYIRYFNSFKTWLYSFKERLVTQGLVYIFFFTYHPWHIIYTNYPLNHQVKSTSHILVHHYGHSTFNMEWPEGFA